MLNKLDGIMKDRTSMIGEYFFQDKDMYIKLKDDFKVMDALEAHIVSQLKSINY
jgi:hypothetical protein